MLCQMLQNGFAVWVTKQISGTGGIKSCDIYPSRKLRLFGAQRQPFYIVRVSENGSKAQSVLVIAGGYPPMRSASLSLQARPLLNVRYDRAATAAAAAESLYISHSMLNRSIRKLEKELCVKLFEHSKNRICLNENGNVAVEEARKVVGQLKRLEKHVRECDISQRTISIASCAPSPLWALAPLLTDYFPELSRIIATA